MMKAKMMSSGGKMKKGYAAGGVPKAKMAAGGGMMKAKMSIGGGVKSKMGMSGGASKRADGDAQRGKTKGRMV